MCYIPFSHFAVLLKTSRNRETEFILELAVLFLVWLHRQEWNKEYLSCKLISPDTDPKVGRKILIIC